MIQLLVHAGAPSARRDDEQYRTQAQAYAAFEGRRVEPRLSTDNSLPQIGYAAVEHLGTEKRGITMFLDDTQLAYNALDSQLNTSSLRGLDQSSLESSRGTTRSISLVGQQKQQSEDGRVVGGYVSPSPHVAHRSPNTTTISSQASLQQHHSHSSYLKSPVLHQSKKRRRRSNPPARNIVTLERIRSTFPLQPGHGLLNSLEGRKTIALIMEKCNDFDGSPDLCAAAEITSELPTSYSLSDITTEDSREKKRTSVSQQSCLHVRGESQTTQPRQAIPMPTTPERYQNLSPARKKRATASGIQQIVSDSPKVTKDFQKLSPSIDRRENSPIASSLPAQIDTSKCGRTTATDLAEEASKPHPETKELQKTLSTLSKSVHPPEPKAGLNKFDTHITETLRYLVEKLKVEKHYKPVSVTRDVEPLERGHWLVDCSPLALTLQIEFWQFMEKTIKSGNAGWGIWCTRGGDYETLGSTADVQMDSIGLVRVFCWGEVVKHIYLMLYVASKAKVRKLGLQWIDAEGKIVVQMKNDNP